MSFLAFRIACCLIMMFSSQMDFRRGILLNLEEEAEDLSLEYLHLSSSVTASVSTQPLADLIKESLFYISVDADWINVCGRVNILIYSVSSNLLNVQF